MRCIGGDQGVRQNERRDLHKTERAAAIQRNIRDLFVVNHLAERRGFGPEQRRLFGNVDDVFHIAGSEREIEPRRLADGQRNVVMCDGLETGLLRGQTIIARLQERD